MKITPDNNNIKLLDELYTDLSISKVATFEDPPQPGEFVDNDFYEENIRKMTFPQPYLHQKESDEALSMGLNVLLMLPTSAGKTHCVLPHIARTIKQGGNVLYIAPTVGLMDDIKKEAKEGFNKIDIEPPQVLNRFVPQHKRNLDNPMIITSIYSVDHLLNNPQYPIENLALIVIDEVHLLVNEVGGHAREIIKRLITHIQDMGGDIPQFALLSATLPNPLELAKKLTYQPADSFAVIDKSTEKRGTKTYLLSEEPIDIEVFCHFMTSRGKTVLVFIDNINDTNALAYNIEKSCAYNSQTTESDRQQLCQKLLAKEINVVFGTSALEVGVNLPNLDVVLITDSNLDMSAIKQRGGRCGRGGRDGLVVIDISQAGINAEGYLAREMRNAQPSQNPDIAKVHFLRLISELCKKHDTMRVPIPANALLRNYPQLDLDESDKHKEYFVIEDDTIKNRMTFSPHRKFMLFTPAQYIPVILHEKGGMRKLGDTNNPKNFASGSTIVFRGEPILVTNISQKRIDCIPYTDRNFSSGFIQSVISIGDPAEGTFKVFDIEDVKLYYYTTNLNITISVIEEGTVITKTHYKTSSFKIEFANTLDYNYGAFNAILRSARHVLGNDSVSYTVRTTDESKVIQFYDLERYGDGARRVGGNIEAIINDSINRLTFCKCENGCINCTYPIKSAILLKKDITKYNALKWLQNFKVLLLT